jgi:predicted O-methyltransferase YrrM
MNAIDQVPDEKARAVLRRLHGEASREYLSLLWKFLPYWIPMFSGKKLRWDRLQRRHDDDYLATSPGGGMHCYLLARAIGAKRIVEFGTSFGVSTIWLALAVRDNGGGTVIGTEYIPAKAAKARSNIAEAGLADFVEVREGNALETLRDLEAPVDFLLSDGFPQYALPVLELVAPKMRQGAIVLNHNALAMKGDHADYVAYVRDPANGFVSSEITFSGELSVRVAAEEPPAAWARERSPGR